jgi:hypothetical protein
MKLCGSGLASKWIRVHKLEEAIGTQGIVMKIKLFIHPWMLVVFFLSVPIAKLGFTRLVLVLLYNY